MYQDDPVWKTVNEFPDYEVSNTGFVRNKKKHTMNPTKQ